MKVGVGCYDKTIGYGELCTGHFPEVCTLPADQSHISFPHLLQTTQYFCSYTINIHRKEGEMQYICHSRVYPVREDGNPD